VYLQECFEVNKQLMDVGHGSTCQPQICVGRGTGKGQLKAWLDTSLYLPVLLTHPVTLQQ